MNGSCGHETGVNQAGRYNATKQTTLLTATASSDTMVISSVQNVSNMTETNKENGVIAVTNQHATTNTETSGILSASELTTSNATAATKQIGFTSVALVTTKENVNSADEQTDFTILSSSTADTNCANEWHGPKAPTSNVFMDSAIQSNISPEVPQLTNISVNTNNKIITFLKCSCNSASEPMTPSNRATDKQPNSMLAYISEGFDISD